MSGTTFCGEFPEEMGSGLRLACWLGAGVNCLRELANQDKRVSSESEPRYPLKIYWLKSNLDAEDFGGAGDVQVHLFDERLNAGVGDHAAQVVHEF